MQIERPTSRGEKCRLGLHLSVAAAHMGPSSSLSSHSIAALPALYAAQNENDAITPTTAHEMSPVAYMSMAAAPSPKMAAMMPSRICSVPSRPSGRRLGSWDDRYTRRVAPGGPSWFISGRSTSSQPSQNCERYGQDLPICYAENRPSPPPNARIRAGRVRRVNPLQVCPFPGAALAFGGFGRGWEDSRSAAPPGHRCDRVPIHRGR